jgi:uncharacterized coiled-coil protein SlyX
MKLTYSIPLQTVTLEITAEEQLQLTEEIRNRLLADFRAMIAHVQEHINALVKPLNREPLNR